MKIHRLETVEGQTDLRIRSLVEYKGRPEYLWYAVDKRYAPYVTVEKMDAFVVGLLVLAMRYNEEMEVDGAVSERLYHNLSNGYMHILQAVVPSLHIIKINPRSLDDGKSHQCVNGVGTGFSGGIDSFCTISDYLVNNKLANYRITHLLFNNVGSHGEWDATTARNLFDTRYDRLKPFAKEMGLDFIKVDSNLSEFLQSKFPLSHSARNLSSVLLLQKLFSKYYYSAGVRYQDCFIGPSDDIGYSEPGTVLLLSTETLECISVGSQYSRVEKTKKVSVMEPSHKWLNVCWFPDARGGNCSVCLKCCRTLLSLEILGKLEEYRNVFDLEKYRKVRNAYIRHLLRNRDDSLYREIIEYARGIGYRFSFWNTFLAYVSCIVFPRFFERKIKGILPESLKERIRSVSRKMGCF